MAHRHLLTVCVVCLLCAHHLPCKEHLPTSKSHENNYRELSFDLEFHSPNSDVGWRSEASHVRAKRHANHEHHSAKHHHLELPQVTTNYIGKIFRTFNESNKMSLHDFESMISYLKLRHLFSNLSKECINEETFLEKMLKKEEHEEHDSELHDHSHESLEINSDQLLAICPILLYHSMSHLEPNVCLKRDNFLLADTSIDDDWTKMEDRNKVWLYSFLSIFLVSLSGLLGVAVIPIMDKHYYHHVLQFLVALAVGTLAGDALLHLLPHSMLPLSPDQDLHQTMMYRGLAALLGIIFFYFFERFLTMVTEMRQRKEKRDKPSSRVRVMRDPETASLNGTTTCKHKYSSYPYCYGEIAMETKDNHHEHQHVDEATVLNQTDDFDQSNYPPKINGVKNFTRDISNDADNTISTSLDEGSIESNALCNNNKNSGNPVSNFSKNEPVQQETYTVILREHQSKHHGHSHTHGHVHSPPVSLSAVVWMVIMGDGLHNFTDGMAIGAAFSNNIAGGFSTSVAVFCHELPHELGDFAVLLKAGMSAKQAVYYNLLSSVLGFLGMCVGVIIGSTPEASQWIFAVAAGLFIYIALVDMLPELTSSHGKEENCIISQCILQFTGMCTGFICMLLIAMYEHDLKEMFTS